MMQDSNDSDHSQPGHPQPESPPAAARNLPQKNRIAKAGGEPLSDERQISRPHAPGDDAALIDLAELSLRTTTQISTTSPHWAPEAAQSYWRPPIAGALSVIFAIVAFYHTTLLMAPLAILCGVIALFRRQFNWGIIGIVAGLVALISDVTFWTLLGVTWAIHWFWWG